MENQMKSGKNFYRILTTYPCSFTIDITIQLLSISDNCIRVGSYIFSRPYAYI